MPTEQQNDEQLMQEWNLSDDNLERWAAVPRIGRKAQVAKELLDRRKPQYEDQDYSRQFTNQPETSSDERKATPSVRPHRRSKSSD